MQRALAGTSLFTGLETARFDEGRFAGFEWGVSVVTLGELRLGVRQARGTEASARRLLTYQLAQRFEPPSVDEAVSDARGHCIWIAATAIAHSVPIVTRDSDYDAMPGVEVIKI